MATNTNTTGDVFHGSTVFVSNLSYSTTDESLRAAFDDLAPVRSCFIVLEKLQAFSEKSGAEPSSSQPKSKGVGFVKFALREDAGNIIAKYGPGVKGEKKEFLMVDGRKVRVGWPGVKPPTNEVKAEGRKTTKKPVAKSTITKDPEANRTLIITNLPSTGLTKSTLWKKIRKCDGAKSIEWPLDGDNTKVSAIFDTPSAATATLSKLHSHVYKGSTLSVTLKRPSGNPSRTSELIVRNLPWDITEADLEAYFSSYGPVHSVRIPSLKSEHNKDDDAATSPKKRRRIRGFAVVGLLSREGATDAIAKLNGTTMYGGFADDRAASEDKHGDKDVSKPQGSRKNERVVAVDWAVGADRWRQIVEEQAQKEGIDDEDSDGEEDEEAPEDWDTELGTDEMSEGNAHDHSMSVDGEERSRPPPPPPEEGSVLFVRNLPFEAISEDLKEVFQKFGPIRYAVVTMNRESGKSRGTGFVCFRNLSDANTCLEEAQRMREDLDPELTKKNPFSLLTVDPSSSRAAPLVLQGRTLDVVRAVTREEAQKFSDRNERAREKEDKRNLYLIREGVIFPSTPSATTLAPAELNRRHQSWSARKTLLRNNPSLFISRTRLSIRNLPLWVTDRGLKRLAIHAKQAFSEEASQGHRAGLTEDELAIPANAAGEQGSRKRKWKGMESMGVKQAKVVRDANRVDPLTGNGRSKGYGFLELETHADALRVLRWANNNPTANKLMWTWWKDELQALSEGRFGTLRTLGGKEGSTGVETRLNRLKSRLEEMDGPGGDKEAKIKDGRSLHIEFAIENILVMRRRQNRQEMAKQRPDKGADGSEGPEPSVKSSRKRKSRDDEDGKPPTPRKKHNSSRMAIREDGDAESALEGHNPKIASKTRVPVGRIIKKKRMERRTKAFAK
ncbi:uncharacterized protein EI90DRAFT_3115348 [Cantharellus anzutake]|uniref:uncharacterized protein n=1 Tax=Cantharellus anzutake TaxID=1750568 RepID=UPI001908F96D|nr:uncharacterized protein EI90DRAFT_3115348 [Cantharellus anzutake]KAF8342810.1 hypothetical protein EI90DRAFT_3115348 [Cantharellus anzutake]